MQINHLLALDNEEVGALIVHHGRALSMPITNAERELRRKRIEQLDEIRTPEHLRIRAA